MEGGRGGRLEDHKLQATETEVLSGHQMSTVQKFAGQRESKHGQHKGRTY